MASSARLTAPMYPPLGFDPHPTGHGSATPSPASSSMDELFRKISTAVADDPDGADLLAKSEAGGGGGITLEEYLSKDDVRVPAGFPVDPSAATSSLLNTPESSSLCFDNLLKKVAKRDMWRLLKVLVRFLLNGMRNYASVEKKNSSLQLLDGNVMATGSGTKMKISSILDPCG